MGGNESALKRLEELEAMFFSSTHDLQIKLVNVLLVASAACIGFAVTQTKEAGLTLLIIPWGSALLLWAISFFFGCKAISYKSEYMHEGAQFVSIIRDVHKGLSESEINQKIDTQKIGYARASKKTELSSKWQFYLFLAGAVFFIVWHILEMWRRTEEYTCVLWY